MRKKKIFKEGLNAEFEVAADLLGYSLFERNLHRIEERVREFYF